MKLKELAQAWETEATRQPIARKFDVSLPVRDAARILSLATMFPGKTETEIINDLLGAALDELGESFPYLQGTKVITEDEFGDPIYQDIGLTPRFHSLTQEHLMALTCENANLQMDKTGT
jgi:hypothetical protein